MKYLNRNEKGTILRIILSLVLLGVYWRFADKLPLTGWQGFVLYLIPYGIVGWDVLKQAGLNAAQKKIFHETIIMSLASIVALCAQAFPEGTLVLLIYQVVELFRVYAEGKSRDAISQLMNIRPEYATCEREGITMRTEPEDVKVGEVILIKPGETIPLDGVILKGESTLNAAAITGESAPRDVSRGDTVLSGCVNLNGMLRIKVTHLYEESTAARILKLLETSSERQSKTEKLIANFAKFYTPVLIGVALGIAILPPLIASGPWLDWIRRGVIFLILSCPCAMAFSVPLAFFGGVGGAFRRGILFQEATNIETLSKAEIMAFDKTGTLTQGTFTVTSVHPRGLNEDGLLFLAATAEYFSNHPIAVSLRAGLEKRIDPTRISDTKEIPGKGVRAYIEGNPVYVGNSALMEQLGIKPDTSFAANGTAVYVAVDHSYAGCIVITDRPKPDAPAAIMELKRLGVRKSVMLSGDNQASAGAVAQQLMLDEYYAELSPEQKVECMEDLVEEKRRGGKVVYVGDGVNDKEVLSMADLGIAMGAFGSDTALETADVVLMEDHPSDVCSAMRIARKTMSVARQNTILPLLVKILVMALAVMGIATLWQAVLAEMCVCVLAICNALRALKTETL